MVRFFVWLLVLGGIGFVLYVTKPTREDYYQKLEDRAAVIAAVDHDAFARLRGGDPVDEMVAAESPFQLLEQTRIDDYVVFSMFTTEYQAPGHGPQSVRTFGVLSTLISLRAR